MRAVKESKKRVEQKRRPGIEKEREFFRQAQV